MNKQQQQQHDTPTPDMAWTLDTHRLQAQQQAEYARQVTHYLHPTKGWKKGNGRRLVLQGRRAPVAYKQRDGLIIHLTKEARRAIIKQVHYGIKETVNGRT